MTASSQLGLGAEFSPFLGRLSLIFLIVLVLGRVLAEKLGLTRRRVPASAYLVALASFLFVLFATDRIDNFCSTHPRYAHGAWGTCD